MATVIIFLFIVFGVCNKANGLPKQDLVYSCRTSDEKDHKTNGFCVSIFECPEMWKLLYIHGDAVVNYVKSTICTDSVNDIMVCCKIPNRNVVKTTPTTVSENLKDLLIFKTSTTAGRKSGRTIAKTTTSSIMIPIVTTIETTTTDNSFAPGRITAAEMEFNETTTETNIINPNKTNGLHKLEKNIEYCELPPSNGVKYPWLVHIKPFHTQCLGMIIENRYILTTSKCGYQAKSINLVQFTTGDSNSSKPTLELSVEAKFQSSTMEDDQSGVALLKLNNSIVYNDYARPICLPLNRTNTETYFGGVLLNGENAENNAEKTNVTVCYYNSMNQQMEQQSLKKTSYERCSTDYLIYCVKSSSHDLEGPLIYTYNNKWYLYGLISNNNKTCPDANTHGIHLTPSLIDFVVENIS